jgi:2,4-diaminopentanoate dehydrogenase
MSSPIRVAVCGLGPIGRRIVAVAAAKQSLEIVGALDIAADLAGRRLSELVEGVRSDATVSTSVEQLLAHGQPDLALHATGSQLSRVFSQFEALLGAGISVISTCEELAFPVTDEQKQLTSQLDGLSKSRGARLLGTGINPGFAMDLWPLVVSATKTDCRHISVHRVLDAAKRREPLQRKVGPGLAPERFRELAGQHAIGHVGLTASAHMLARGLGRLVESESETIEPVVATTETASQYFRVLPGQVVGLDQRLTARLSGGVSLDLHLEMYIGAPDPQDEVVIRGGGGTTTVVVRGGFPGDEATAAVITNCIGPLLASAPGYHTMVDLPVFGCLP